MILICLILSCFIRLNCLVFLCCIIDSLIIRCFIYVQWLILGLICRLIRYILLVSYLLWLGQLITCLILLSILCCVYILLICTIVCYILLDFLGIYKLQKLFLNQLSVYIKYFLLILFNYWIKLIFIIFFGEKFDLFIRNWCASTFLNSKLIWKIVETITKAFSIARWTVKLL